MKLFLQACVALVLISNTLFANEIILEEQYKVISTFSGDFEKKNSFHIIIAKNKETKKYEFIPVSCFNKSLNRKPSIISNFSSAPAIESYHITKDNSVLLLVKVGSMHPIRKYVIDIDFETGESRISKSITNHQLKATLKLKNKQLMIGRYSNDLHIYQIFDFDSILDFKLSKNTENKPFFKGIGKTNFDAININEFVSNGSISDFKIYCDSHDNLYLTKDNLQDRESYIMKFNLKNTTSNDVKFTHKMFNFSQFETVRDMGSYIHQGKLFHLLLNRDIIFLNINDVTSGEVKSLNLRQHTDKMNFSDGFVSLEDFLKNAAKSKYSPTVTVNDHLEDNLLIVRCDYVLPETYSYNYNWWWWHHQQFMRQQQMHMNNIRSFGPSNLLDDYSFLISESKEKHYFEIVFEKSTLEPLDAPIAYKYKHIDKKAISKEYRDKTYNYESSVFLESEYVQFYQDAKSKVFKISRRLFND